MRIITIVKIHYSVILFYSVDDRYSKYYTTSKLLLFTVLLLEYITNPCTLLSLQRREMMCG